MKTRRTFRGKPSVTRYLNAEYKQKKVDFDDISLLEEFRKELKEGVKAPVEESKFSKKFAKLSNAIRHIVEDFSLISLLPLDVTDEETITDLIYHCDHNIQYGENLEPDEKAYLHAEGRLAGEQQEDFDYDPADIN